MNLEQTLELKQELTLAVAELSKERLIGVLETAHRFGLRAEVHAQRRVPLVITPENVFFLRQSKG